MHPEARSWVARHATDAPFRVLDIGGRDINGTVRDLFPHAQYWVLDILPGEDVDICADAATYRSDLRFDLVLSCECFEHTPVWRDIIVTVYEHLTPGGRFVATMAGPGRAPHSGVDGGWELHPGEHYQNIDPGELRKALETAGFTEVMVDWQRNPDDVRAVATRGIGC